MRYLLSLVFVCVLLVGCVDEEEEHSFPEEDWCMDNIKDLSCDQLLECYDWCENHPAITFAAYCREGYKARLWKCYGGDRE